MSQLNDVTVSEEKYKKLILAMDVCKVLAKCWHYGDWKWETPNERVMEMLMRQLELYPFKNEDEMIEGTKVAEELYELAMKEIGGVQNDR